MINFEELKKQPIDADIEAFLKPLNGNHVRMLREWAKNHEMRDDVGAVYQQLCYAVQQGHKVLTQRTFGRYKVLRNAAEVESMNKTLGIETEVDVLS